jgi:hypothetical protein
LPADDPAREQHLTRARELFGQIGAMYERARTEEALAQAQPMTAATNSV